MMILSVVLTGSQSIIDLKHVQYYIPVPHLSKYSLPAIIIQSVVQKNSHRLGDVWLKKITAHPTPVHDLHTPHGRLICERNVD